MKLLIVIAAFALVGCSTTVPVVMKFPDVPKELLEACPNLKLADNSPKPSISSSLNDAIFTHRIVDESKQTFVGGSTEYESLCRKHYCIETQHQ